MEDIIIHILFKYEPHSPLPWSSKGRSNDSMKFRVYGFIIYIGLHMAPLGSETYNQKDKLCVPKHPVYNEETG